MKIVNVTLELNTRSFPLLLKTCCWDGNLCKAEDGTTDTNAYLFWYKQQINDLPRFMLRRFTVGEGDNAAEFHKDRFDAQIQNKSVPLRIQNLQLSDSALYYCALRPTVTGNTDSLYKNMLSRKHTSLFP
uniref:Ig-like domain-containing protein n=1 Tax=Gadus morhua TaxID=8049 RepID=A0A8C5AJ49_GADMO